MKSAEGLHIFDNCSKYEDTMEQKGSHIKERKLIVSVILRAVKDYIDGNNPQKIGRLREHGQDHELSQLQKNSRSARFWIYEERNAEYIFSFEKCCEVISVSPERIRRGLNQLIQTNYRIPNPKLSQLV